MRRRRRLLLGAVAVLAAVTLAAGVAVVRLLPGRVAAWRPQRIAAAPVASPGPVLMPAATAVGAYAGVTTAGLTRALSGVIGSKVYGPAVGVEVASLTSGQVLYSSNPAAGFTPASTNKLATATAALTTLGPDKTFQTTVVAGPAADSVILVGGGDPTLAGATAPAGDYPEPATLSSLAAKTAKALKARGVHAVHLGYDTSLYSGPGLAPGWTQSYVATGNVTEITPLEVDQGRVIHGKPADSVGGGLRSDDPAPQAAGFFADYLAADGIKVAGKPAPATAKSGAATLASVSSPPLAQIVQQMLEQSNNVYAENLSRQVAIATRRPASFSGGAAADTAVLRSLGVSGELRLYDGSGLSPDDKIAPALLVQLVRLDASRPQLGAIMSGLPVDGFTGTLGPGGSVFGSGGASGLGVVRAKTGNLDQAAALAGSAYAADGQVLVFAIMADKIPAGGLTAAATQMVKVASVLAGCGCR